MTGGEARGTVRSMRGLFRADREDLRVALAGGAAFLLVTALTRNAIPFFQYPMFVFEAPTRPTALPLFMADGRIDRESKYTNFTGIGPEHVDVHHTGYPCAAEHLLHEIAVYLENHQAPPGTPEGPVQVSVGLRLAHIGEDGRPVVVERIDKTGRAWPVSP